jgi:hypothetical protein
MKSKLIVIVALTLATCLMGLAFLHVYYVNEGATGDLLWNGEEAYLIVSVGSLGYRLSCLQAPMEFLRAYFRAGVSSSDNRSSVFLVKITPDGIQRYETQHLSLSSVNPVGNNIYARSDGGFVKWSGTRFEPASSQELQLFNSRRESGPDFTNIDGWSKRCCLMNRAAESRFDIQMGTKSATLVVKQGIRDSNISVSLERQGQAPEKIWYLDQQAHKVSRAEYEQTFARR